MESLSEASPLRARPRPSYTEPTYSNISDPEDSEEEEDAGKTADAQQADPATRQATRTEHKPAANSVTLSNPNPSMSNSCGESSSAQYRAMLMIKMMTTVSLGPLDRKVVQDSDTNIMIPNGNQLH